MRVLLLESDRHAGDQVIERLTAAGHQVVRCHEVDLGAFPCNALCADGSCPLETGAPVDVVVDYRAHPYPHPTPLEDGVSCALRHNLPLVVAGVSALNPFDKWTTAIADDADIVDACEQAVLEPDRFLSEAATITLRDTMLRHGLDVNGASVTVTRRSGSVRAAMELPDKADWDDDALAVAVAGAVAPPRAAGPHRRRLRIRAARRGLSDAHRGWRRRKRQRAPCPRMGRR